MSEFLRVCLIVCPLVFAAGFVDAIAGGGGLISLPAYLLAGFPAHLAMGTNKTAMGVGAIVSSAKYIKAKKFDLKVAAFSAAGAFSGACIGSGTAMLISDKALKIVMLAVLPAVAVFLFAKKDFGKNEAEEKQMSAKRLAVTSLFIGLVLGIYDGLVGPGTGTFLILAFTAFMGFDLLKSSGCAKAANLASNLASMIVFIASGNVNFTVAGAAAVCAIAGNYLGARLAIKGGSKYVRYTVFLVIGLLFIKITAEIF